MKTASLGHLFRGLKPATSVESHRIIKPSDIVDSLVAICQFGAGANKIDAHSLFDHTFDKAVVNGNLPDECKATIIESLDWRG